MGRALIIGGGAASLMAAIHAAREGAKVTVLEHNQKIGRKLLASGNGKCNLTNLDLDLSAYQASDPAFVDAVISKFNPLQTIAFFTSLGLMTREREAWVYPQSNQASAVLSCLYDEARRLGVQIKTKEEVLAVERAGESYLVRTDSWQYEAACVIVACGSPASDIKGSSDFAARLAESMELPFEAFRPALVPLRVRGDYCGKWAGARLFGEVRLYIDDQLYAAERGIIQLASYGISGIPVFNLSLAAVRACEEHRVTLSLDCFPELEESELKERIRAQKKRTPERSMRAILGGMIPSQLAEVYAEIASDADGLGTLLKAFRMEIKGAASIRHAQICTGGIPCDALCENLQSKTNPGLFFAGEAIDVAGPCGGYNLQWAWSSGRLAGQSAAKYLADLDADRKQARP